MTDEVSNEIPSAPQSLLLEDMTHAQLVAYARGLERGATRAMRNGACDELQISQLGNGIAVMSEQKHKNFQDYQQLDHNARFLLSFVEPLTKALLHEVDTAPTTECLEPRCFASGRSSGGSTRARRRGSLNGSCLRRAGRTSTKRPVPLPGPSV